MSPLARGAAVRSAGERAHPRRQAAATRSTTARHPPDIAEDFIPQPSTTSEQAFCALALRYLAVMVDRRGATARGDLAALHQFRIAITCLRTAVAFFSPMVDGAQWRRLKREIKWLNGYLGAARDLDVVVQRLRADSRRDVAPAPHLLTERWNASHARVARALQSRRYERLIDALRVWIRNGRWRRGVQKDLALARTEPLSRYAVRRLKRWTRHIHRRSRNLAGMDAEARHRLRIRTKKVRYAMEWFGALMPGVTTNRLRATLRQLRRAQDCLGALNDAARASDLIRPLRRNDGRNHGFKGKKRLMHEAQAAFETLGRLTKRR